MAEYLEFVANKKNQNECDFKHISYLESKTEKNHQKALEKFKMMIESSTNLALKDKSFSFDNSFLFRFLYARKFNCEDSMTLLINYFLNKRNNTYMQNINIFDQKIQYALLDGNPGLIAERDRRGRKVITFNAANWDVTKYALEDIYRALLLTLDTLLDNTQNQVLGFVIVVDWTNFSYKLSKHITPKGLKLIIDGLQNSIPAKFKGIHFIGQPWYINFIFGAIKPFLLEKTRKRFYNHGSNLSSMHNIICKDILPSDLGGEAPSINHSDWFHYLVACSQSSNIPRDYRITKDVIYSR